MCGRFVRIKTVQEIASIFAIEEIESNLDPSYNITPRQPIVVVVEEGKKKLVSMQWGLIPHWAKDDKIANKLINARAETIEQKPSFRDSFVKRRCIIVADGFYEWVKRGNKKIPVYIKLKSEQTFGMAGIYDIWKTPEGNVRTTCTIVTTEANAFMKGIHHRMPVILVPELYEVWLDPKNKDVEQLKGILKRLITIPLGFHEVDSQVNSGHINNESCIEPFREDE